MSLDKVSHAQKQRLQFIETVAYWEGIVGRPNVSSIFDVSENHITRDFALYRKSFPGNLTYDVTVRAYRPSSSFSPKLGAGSPEEYLALLRTYLDTKSTAVLPSIGHGVAAACLPPSAAPLAKDVLREITRALRQEKGVLIRYQSLTSPAPATREVWPHALVFAGARWHIRAYDHKRGAFIDLVLHRVLSARTIDRPSPFSNEDDLDWQESIDIDILPASRLNDSQKAVIAKEYGMVEVDQEWVWRVNLKRCLVPYFLRWLRLDLGPDESYPITLKDPALPRLFRFGDI
jgi:predicted DNA-binding transcriptional regulator YafY